MLLFQPFFGRDPPRIIYDLIQMKKIIMLYSIEIEKELIGVLAYPKFRVPSNEIQPIINNIRRNAVFILTKSKIDVIKTDFTDSIFLECAIDGKADFIISGDKHLLTLKEYQGISILSPSEFLYLI